MRTQKLEGMEKGLKKKKKGKKGKLKKDREGVIKMK